MFIAGTNGIVTANNKQIETDIIVIYLEQHELNALIKCGILQDDEKTKRTFIANDTAFLTLPNKILGTELELCSDNLFVLDKVDTNFLCGKTDDYQRFRAKVFATAKDGLCLEDILTNVKTEQYNFDTRKGTQEDIDIIYEEEPEYALVKFKTSAFFDVVEVIKNLPNDFEIFVSDNYSYLVYLVNSPKEYIQFQYICSEFNLEQSDVPIEYLFEHSNTSYTREEILTQL